ncbi:ORF371 [Staphylococcus phage Twort]|uniref:ORF371 n=1 Tax=Staphylococcus phage Twort (strain DSM 17442 / HER 48) TaxID=2908167 RepID=Q4Z9A6_BPTWO|nr:ORF371 [Staphylococcus phage Twort]AAX92486.1 ORF371 [Staphylococcus phage Twort]
MSITNKHINYNYKNKVQRLSRCWEYTQVSGSGRGLT